MTKEETRRVNTIDPHQVVLVGIDTPDGDEHPLYDHERDSEPIPAGFVENIRRYGVMQPVVVVPYKGKGNGGEWAAHTGKRRIRAARKAKLSSVPFQHLADLGIAKGDVEATAQATNLHLLDPKYLRAKKCARLFKRMRGTSEQRRKAAAVAFGTTVGNVDGCIRYTKLPDFVQKACESGKISYTTAVAMHGAKTSDMKAALAGLQPGETLKGKDAPKGAKPRKKTFKSSNAASLRAFLDGFASFNTKGAVIEDDIRERFAIAQEHFETVTAYGKDAGGKFQAFVDGVSYARGEASPEEWSADFVNLVRTVSGYPPIEPADIPEGVSD